MRDLVRRQVDFEFEPEATPRNWYREDPHLTSFWNALSLLFPEGERFFVESVRRYRDRIDDPALRAAIEGFIGQEAMHGRGHRAFNGVLRGRSRQVAHDVEGQLRRLLDRGRNKLSPKAQLAVTCALEHFTAILAEQFLARGDHRDAAHPSVRPLWLWHALEESEHKNVAFDVYRAISGGYALRIVMMLTTTAFFFAEVANVHVRLLNAEGQAFSLRGWLRSLYYFWIAPGLFLRLIPAYFDYFRPSFHPDGRDTDSLLTFWNEELFGSAGLLKAQLKNEVPHTAGGELTPAS